MFHFHGWLNFHCVCVPHSLCWWTSSLVLFPCRCEQGSREHGCASISVTGLESFGYASEVAQQIHVGILVLVFREAAAPISTVAVPLDTASNNDEGSSFPHLPQCSLSLVFLLKTILTWVRWNLKVILFVVLWWIKMLDTFLNSYSPFFFFGEPPVQFSGSLINSQSWCWGG